MITNNPPGKPEEPHSSHKINPFKESHSDASHEKSHEKINPFKELPKPHQPQAEHSSSSSHSTSHSHSSSPAEKKAKEITITLKPWKMVKGFLVLVLLLGIFLLGRWSTGADSLSLPDFSTMFSHESGPSGLVTGDTEVKDSAPESTATETQAAAATEDSAASASETETADETVAAVNSTASDGSENDVPEKIIAGSYSRVTLSIDGVYKDWKGNWGKIKGIKYTITNEEAGTIKPHHFIMSLEGYTEYGDKTFDASYSSQRVKAGQTLSDESAVSGGYAYSATQIPDGDLKRVHVNLVLVDVDGVTIASADQDLDLSSGEVPAATNSTN